MEDTYIEYLNEESSQYQSTSHFKTAVEEESCNRYFSLKVHGTKSAIEFKADTTRSGFKTIRIESAIIMGGGDGKNKRYDWREKIAIQLTKTDLLDFIAAMLLIKKNAVFRHYGERNDKGAKFEFQGDNPKQKKVFAQISQKSKPMMGTPIPLEEAIQIGHMALNEYIKNFPNITSGSVIHTLERLAYLNTNTTHEQPST